jgi:hypothetical protein
LKAIENDLDGNYIILNDIDLSIYGVLTQSFINGTFTGNLSGQSFTVLGLAVESPNNSGTIGLFKTLSGSSIEDLTLEAFNITGNGGGSGFRFGALAGEVSGPNTRLKNIIVTNSSIDTTTGGESGALIGILQRGTLELENITISAIVKGTSYIGGLIGFVDGLHSEVLTGSNITILNTNPNPNSNANPNLSIKGHLFGTIRQSVVNITNINIINGESLKLVGFRFDNQTTYLVTPDDNAATDFSNASIIAP